MRKYPIQTKPAVLWAQFQTTVLYL